MKHLCHLTLFVLNLFILGSLIGQSGVEIRPDGLVLPPIKYESIANPDTGLLVQYQGNVSIYSGTDWKDLTPTPWRISTSKITYQNNVGIGVTNPTDFLHINSPAGEDVIRIQRNNNTKFRIWENGAIAIGSNWDVPLFNTLRINTQKTIVNDTLVLQNNSFELTEQGGIRMYNSIGTETIKIDPDMSGFGRVKSSQLELTGGSDFAENFSVQESHKRAIEPGLIVSVTNEIGNLKLTDSKRDKKVVGIISGANGIKTGMLMGQEGSIADGEFPIALSGRTYVFANAENGSIKIGDFLTSSSVPGYAMKVKKFRKAQGAIIGKALTELKSGSGYVLVLVNLQ